MPGIYLPERKDECAAYKDWRIRQDENEAAQASVVPSRGLPNQQQPVSASSRIYVAARAALVAIFIFVLYGVVGRIEADALDAHAKAWHERIRPVTEASVFPPNCDPVNAAGERLAVAIAQRRDMDFNWIHYCGYEPEGGTRL